ncbi:unnamed protein product, partial [Ceratitis capitata]
MTLNYNYGVAGLLRYNSMKFLDGSENKAWQQQKCVPLPWFYVRTMSSECFMESSADIRELKNFNLRNTTKVLVGDWRLNLEYKAALKI